MWGWSVKAFDGDTFSSDISLDGTARRKSPKPPNEWRKHAMLLYPGGDCFLVDTTTDRATKLQLCEALVSGRRGFTRNLGESPVAMIEMRRGDNCGVGPTGWQWKGCEDHPMWTACSSSEKDNWHCSVQQVHDTPNNQKGLARSLQVWMAFLTDVWSWQ